MPANKINKDGGKDSVCRRIEGNIVEVVGGEDSDEDQDTSDSESSGEEDDRSEQESDSEEESDEESEDDSTCPAKV